MIVRMVMCLGLLTCSLPQTVVACAPDETCSPGESAFTESKPFAHMALSGWIRATVIIQGDEGSQYEIGAGVIIQEDSVSLTIVTAYHVASHQNLRVMTSDSEVLDVYGVTQIAGVDIALVRTPRPRGWVRVASIATPGPTGSAIAVVGFKPSIFWSQSSGSVVAVTLPPSGAGEFAFVCDCGSGDSGAGVWNASGQLTGILTGHYTSIDGSSIVFVAEPMSVLRQGRPEN
ncbi:MAG: serine protease [Candidatus Aquilonibacter sp.]